MQRPKVRNPLMTQRWYHATAKTKTQGQTEWQVPKRKIESAIFRKIFIKALWRSQGMRWGLERRRLPLLSRLRRFPQQQPRGRTWSRSDSRSPRSTVMRKRRELAQGVGRSLKLMKNFWLHSRRTCELKCWLVTRCRFPGRRLSGFQHRTPEWRRAQRARPGLAASALPTQPKAL